MQATVLCWRLRAPLPEEMAWPSKTLSSEAQASPLPLTPPLAWRAWRCIPPASEVFIWGVGGRLRGGGPCGPS